MLVYSSRKAVEMEQEAQQALQKSLGEGLKNARRTHAGASSATLDSTKMREAWGRCFQPLRMMLQVSLSPFVEARCELLHQRIVVFEAARPIPRSERVL